MPRARKRIAPSAGKRWFPSGGAAPMGWVTTSVPSVVWSVGVATARDSTSIACNRPSPEGLGETAPSGVETSCRRWPPPMSVAAGCARSRAPSIGSVPRFGTVTPVGRERNVGPSQWYRVRLGPARANSPVGPSNGVSVVGTGTSPIGPGADVFVIVVPTAPGGTDAVQSAGWSDERVSARRLGPVPCSASGQKWSATARCCGWGPTAPSPPGCGRRRPARARARPG
jgi:hypothetical protein